MADLLRELVKWRKQYDFADCNADHDEAVYEAKKACWHGLDALIDALALAQAGEESRDLLVHDVLAVLKRRAAEIKAQAMKGES